jgi:hypothetical protein
MKNLPTALRDALASGAFIPRFFVKGEISGEYIGFWNDVGEVEVDDVPYEGSGALVGISRAGGGVSDMSVPGLTVTLSGIARDVLATFFGETWHQKPMALDIGFLSPDTRELLAPLDRAFSGFMDAAKRKGGAKKKATLEISCEDASWRLTRSFADVRSDANQRDRDPTDTFMKRLAVAARSTVYYNQPSPNTKAYIPSFGKIAFK